MKELPYSRHFNNHKFSLHCSIDISYHRHTQTYHRHWYLKSQTYTDISQTLTSHITDMLAAAKFVTWPPFSCPCPCHWRRPLLSKSAITFTLRQLSPLNFHKTGATKGIDCNDGASHCLDRPLIAIWSEINWQFLPTIWLKPYNIELVELSSFWLTQF